MRVEKIAQNKFKDLVSSCGLWVQSLEPGLGSDFGLPDLLIKGKGETNSIIPVEMKMVVSKLPWVSKSGVKLFDIVCSKVKASQIIWHNNFRKAGGISVFCFAEAVGENFDFYISNSENISKVGSNKIGRWDFVPIGGESFDFDKERIENWAQRG